MVKRIVTATEQQESRIRAQMQSGANSNDSTYVRDLIRRDQTRQHSSDLEALREALVQGEESGEPKPFDASQFKREMKDKHSRGER